MSNRIKWNEPKKIRFQIWAKFCFILYTYYIGMYGLILKTRMPKWMKWNKKSGFRFGLKFVYIVHILGRHKEHYSFKDKNAKMDEMKLKSDFKFRLKFVLYCTHIPLCFLLTFPPSLSSPNRYSSYQPLHLVPSSQLLVTAFSWHFST